MSRRRRQRGQTLVEFAMVIPIFLALVLGIIDLGRVIWANDVLASAAREGARWASVRGTSPFTPTASKDQVKAETLSFVGGAVSAPVVYVCYSSVGIAQNSIGCSGDANQPANATAGRGNLVTVRVTGQVGSILGRLVGLGTFTITSTSTVLVNN
jgi:Flp pilus assembly protein TadG